jgi:hypothetical protein
MKKYYCGRPPASALYKSFDWISPEAWLFAMASSNSSTLFLRPELSDIAKARFIKILRKLQSCVGEDSRILEFTQSFLLKPVTGY